MPKTVSFKELMENVRESYLGKEVPIQYKKDYGKIYNEKDLEKLGIRIAKAKGITIEK